MELRRKKTEKIINAITFAFVVLILVAFFLQNAGYIGDIYVIIRPLAGVVALLQMYNIGGKYKVPAIIGACICAVLIVWFTVDAVMFYAAK